MLPKTKNKKPSKLLNRRATATNKSITEKNANHSPLLSLPPEIRNKIYEYVLGGNTLHITSWIPSVRHSICKIDKDTDYERCDYEYNYYDRRHTAAGCDITGYNNNRSTVSLALLRVCRQLHNEAALVPYMTNTFAFISVLVFERFSQSLLPVQQRAVRKIIISGPGQRCVFQRPTTISNLENLSEFTYHGAYAEPNEYVFAEHLLQRLEKMSLSKVSIRLTVSQWEYTRPHVPGVAAQTHEIENRLLRRRAVNVAS